MKSACELLQEADLPAVVRRVGIEIVRAAPSYVSLGTIVERTGLDPFVVRKAIRALEARGFVDVRPSLYRDQEGARVITEGRA